MTVLLNCLWVGVGGFFGSVLRYLFGTMVDQTAFPWGTLVINIIGSLFIGFIASYFAYHFEVNPRILLFLRVGLCGGFTTFSAFSLESFQMIQKGDILPAAFYITLSCVACIIACGLGYFVAETAVAVKS